MTIMQTASAGPAAQAVGDSFERFDVQASWNLLSLLAEAGPEAGEGVGGAPAGPGCAAQMAAFFRGLSERIDLASFEVRDFVARGAEVLSFGTFTGRLRPGQAATTSDWAIHWRVESGRLRMSKAFVDTLGQPPTLAA